MRTERKTVKTNMAGYLCIILIVCCLGGALSIGMFFKSMGIYHQGRMAYEQLRNIAYSKNISGMDAVKNNSEIAKMDENLEGIDEDVLQELNSDYKLWLRIPETAIDYPVVQGGNNEYYLNHTFTKENNAAGAIFADFRRPPMIVDNTIIYGHNMRDGSMLASLKAYTKSSYLEEHPNIFLFYRGQWVACPIFSCQLRDDTDAGAYQTDLSYAEWKAYLSEMQEASLYPITTDTGIENVKHIITLSTCYGTDRRMIVQAYLPPDTI